MSNQLRQNIHWVGAVDSTLKYFHGHELSISRGTTYNSYLIVDEKVALIDTVKTTHVEDFLRNIERIIPLEKIDYLIVNHAEPDHSGSIPALLERNPRIKIVCSRGGKTSVARHCPGGYNLQIVKTGDSLSLGKRNLRFFEAQMLHWPDTMFSYCPEEKILFSTDAFGQHYAHSSHFADEVDDCELWAEAIKYFANILTPFCGQIIKKINEYAALGWPFEMICPSHGMIWRKNPNRIVEKYLEWSSGRAEASVVVVYDSIWKGTERMAKAICRGIEAEGMPFKLFYTGVADLNDVMTEVLKAKGFLVGCPTLNNNIMPSLAPYLEEMRGLRFLNKIGAAFGTYGWSGEGVKRLEEALEKATVKVVQPGIKILFKPNDEDLKSCEQFGRNFAKQVRSSCG